MTHLVWEKSAFLNLYLVHQLPGWTDNEIKNYPNTRIKRSGLPLYPVEMQQQGGTSNLVQENQSHVNPLISCSKISPSLSDQTIPNQGSPVSILDQINMSNPNPVTGMNRVNSFPSVAFLGFKRFGGNHIGFSFPCSHVQQASGPPQYSQSAPTQLPVNHFDCQNYDKQPLEILQTPYESDGLVLPGFSSVMKSELPLIQGREPASEGMPTGTPNEYMLLYQQNSGLLDAMIEDLQAKEGHEAMSLDQKCGLDELVWSASTPLPASKVIHSPAPGFRHDIGGMSYTAIANGRLCKIGILCICFSDSFGLGEISIFKHVVLPSSRVG